MRDMVKFAVCAGLGHPFSANVNVIWTLTLASGLARRVSLL